MKKAVVVGGSNGIGLAVVNDLINRDYHVYIVDVHEPDAYFLPKKENYSYFPSNLLDFEAPLFEHLSNDENVELLMITAGFGRVADFECLHAAEIENIIKVNTIAGIQIIRHFYKRIKSHKDFYCGIMGSIAGLISSPMFSVYAASKAAICRFVESINIELEAAGVNNRILNISPGSIKGTRFNGGNNNLQQTQELAMQITENLFNRKTLLIPEYDTVYRDVLARYQNDPHTFGLDSYQYKLSSGRAVNKKAVKIGYLSGTFDLFHIGHLNLLRRAKGQCDYLIVGVHPDASHKGKTTYIPFEERLAIVGAIQYVDMVVTSCKEDSDAWCMYHYDKLFVGSDYKGTARFLKYEEYFADKDVEIIYFPYTKGTSSSQLRKTIDTVIESK